MKKWVLTALFFVVSPVHAAIEMSSWLTYQNADETPLNLYGQKFTSICVFAYDFDTNDNLRPAQPWVDTELARLMANRVPGRPVLITIVNDIESPVPQQHNGDLVLRILSDPAKRARHIQQLVALSAKADGIEIDYESLLSGTRSYYSQFIKELRQALPQGKLLSAVCQPKTDNSDGPRGNAIDWVAIHPYLDYVKVMTYYYSFGGSPPGPSAPLDKVDAVTALAVSEIPAPKLHIVLTQFGWDWPNGSNGRFVDYNEALQVAQDHGAAPFRDSAELVTRINYTDAGTPHQIWVDNDASLRARIARIEAKGVHKIDVWELGVGQREFWEWARDNTINPNGNPGNPVPTLTGISPASAVAGDAGFALTVNGADFIGASVVQWNGSNRSTTFVSATQLTAAIAASDIAAAGNAQVRVFNPAPQGGSSAQATFTITPPSPTPPPPTNPIPQISSLSPSSATVGNAGFALTVTGSNFMAGSIVRWNDDDHATTMINNTTLTAAIPSSDLVAGVSMVTVFNPPPGGGTSQAKPFSISNPPSSTPPGPSPVPPGPSPAVPVSFSDLTQVRAYPNPWTADQHGGAHVRFDQMTPGSTIKIFTLSAAWVASLTAGDTGADWNLTNSDGEAVASGYYLYLITDPNGNRTTGKIAIVK